MIVLLLSATLLQLCQAIALLRQNRERLEDQPLRRPGARQAASNKDAHVPKQDLMMENSISDRDYYKQSSVDKMELDVSKSYLKEILKYMSDHDEILSKVESLDIVLEDGIAEDNSKDSEDDFFARAHSKDSDEEIDEFLNDQKNVFDLWNY